MKISSATPSRRASELLVVGTVWQEAIVEAPEPARLRATRVSFDPGARTNWHTHPLGQTLYVVHGVGLVQSDGGPVRRIGAGDTVFIHPGERHWHGASASHGMIHIAMQESDGGKHATWMEPVSDEDYSRQPAVGRE